MKKGMGLKVLSVIGLGAVLAGCNLTVDTQVPNGGKPVERKGELVSFYDSVKLGDTIEDVKKATKELDGEKGVEVLTRKDEFTEVKGKDGSSVYLRYDKKGDTVEKSLLYSEKQKNVTGLLKTLSKKNTKEFGGYDALYKVKYEVPTNVVDKDGNPVPKSKDEKGKEVKDPKAVYNERYEWREESRLVSVYTSQMGDTVRVFEGELSTEPAPIVVDTGKDAKETKDKK